MTPGTPQDGQSRDGDESRIAALAAERDRYQSMLARIKAFAPDIWTAADCRIGAITALDGPEAGRAEMLAQEAKRDG